MSKWFYSGLPRSVYVLFVSRIINRLGDFVRFFLTLYLTRFLHMDERTTGLVVTLAAAATMAGTLGSGKLTDTAGRKRIMLGAQILSAATLIICGFIPESAALPALLILSQLFLGAIRPASQALLMDLTPPEDRQKAFSLLYLGINIGVAVGPMIAGFLFESYRRWIFWGDALTTLASVFLVARLVPETSSSSAQRSGDAREAEVSGSTIKAFLSRPILAVFTGIIIITSFIYAQSGFSIPLLLETVFSGRGAKLFGIIMSVNAVTVILFTPLILRLVEKRPPLKNLIAGCLAFGIGFGLLSLQVKSFTFFIASTILWTWGEIIFATNVNVFVTAHTPVNHRGRFGAIRQLADAFGSTLSPLAAGFLIQAIGIRGVWIPVFGLSLFSAFGMFSLYRIERRTGA